jgi:GTPase
VPALPLVVIVGRPNVGKSTLVNRIVGRRETIVEERPGVTRDRKEVEAEWSGRRFRLMDTGGWLATGDSLDQKVSEQAERAVASASLVIFVLDVITGITEEDELVAKWLRKTKRPVLVLANKTDSERREAEIWEFLNLGLGEPLSVSALQGRNAGDLLDTIVSKLPEEDEPSQAEPVEIKEPRVAIVGRPNVGKSTLFNRMVGGDRSIVHDLAGTTRDSIDTVVETEVGTIRFVDTAGMRRRARVDESTEYYSMVRALQSVDQGDLVLLVIDSIDGVTHQDQRLAERIEVSGKAVIIVLNKWEQLDAEGRANLTIEIGRKLGFVSYASVLKVSALTGKGVHKLLPSIGDALDAYKHRLSTAEVTKVIRKAQQTHPIPNAKIYYATQGAIEPPTFVLFSNREIPTSYLRYLDRRLREHFNLGPTPLKMRVRRRDAS